MECSKVLYARIFFDFLLFNNNNNNNNKTESDVATYCLTSGPLQCHGRTKFMNMTKHGLL